MITKFCNLLQIQSFSEKFSAQRLSDYQILVKGGLPRVQLVITAVNNRKYTSKRLRQSPQSTPTALAAHPEHMINRPGVDGAIHQTSPIPKE